MAVAEIIGAAIGVMLLVIVAYMLVGSVLTTAEIVTNAQKDLTLLQESRMRTDFTIDKLGKWNDSSEIRYNISNTGTEIIRDFDHTEVLVKKNGNYQLCKYDPIGGTPGTWNIYDNFPTLDIIHPNFLDPGETFRIRVTISNGPPEWFQMTTGNGVYASAYV